MNKTQYANRFSEVPAISFIFLLSQMTRWATVLKNL